jgi:hypothetical protein
MQWKPFEFRGKVYDLAHLHPLSVIYKQPAKANAPARVYRVDVIFGLHCFTRGRNEDETIESALLYGDDRETRVFDLVRFELSKRLPEIIDTLPRRKCYHTGKGNFFSIEIVQGGRQCHRIRHLLCRFPLFPEGQHQSIRPERVCPRQGTRLEPARHEADRLLCHSLQYAE